MEVEITFKNCFFQNQCTDFPQISIYRFCESCTLQWAAKPDLQTILANTGQVVQLYAFLDKTHLQKYFSSKPILRLLPFTDSVDTAFNIRNKTKLHLVNFGHYVCKIFFGSRNAVCRPTTKPHLENIFYHYRERCENAIIFWKSNCYDRV